MSNPQNVSVLITCYNRAHLLDRSLPTIIKQLSTCCDEIIVVDDGSIDVSTKVVCDKYRHIFPNIKYFRREKKGYNNGAIPKNIALRNAKNELIIVSDPEVMHYTDCINKMRQHHYNNEKLCTVAGKMYFVGKDFQPQIEMFQVDPIAYVKDEIGIPFREGNGWFDERKNMWFMENQMAPFIGSFRKEDLMSINGWDERFDKFWGHDDSVTKDTPITIRQNGFINIIPIEDLVPKWKKDNGLLRHKIKDTEVLTRNGFKKIKYVYRHKVNKPIYKIHTTGGVIKVTGDHSLFINNKEILVKDLNIGDKIDCIKLYKDTNLFNNMVEDFAWYAGFFTAEGTAGIYRNGKQYNWAIVNQNIKLLEKCKYIAEKTYCMPFKIYKCNDKGKDIFKLMPLIEKQGYTRTYLKEFYTQNYEKKIPQVILNSNKKIKKAFLQGLIDGDGGRDKWHIGITTKSFTLARGIEQLLTDIGKEAIITTRRDKPNIFLLRIKKTNKRNKIGISKIEIDNKFNDYVYDIATEDGTFVAGLGGIIAHNTDLLTRLRIYGVRQVVDNEMIGIHQYHERPTPQSMVGVDSVNLAIVHEHNNNLEYLANKDNPNWGLNEIE